MKIKTLQNISLVLTILGGFVAIKVFFGLEPPTLESKIAILITIIPAIILQVIVYYKKKKEKERIKS